MRIEMPVCRYILRYVFDSIFSQFDRRPSEPAGFFFASDDVNQADYLMIIIHGMGAVRAGQWSRKYFTSFVLWKKSKSIYCARLIINEHLKIGTQSDYIRRAQENGYAVIVTNTNLNIDESSESNIRLSQRIRVSLKPCVDGFEVFHNLLTASQIDKSHLNMSTPRLFLLCEK